MDRVCIFDAVRTPRGRGKPDGSLYVVRPVDLLVSVLRGLTDRNAFPTAEIDDVIVGCATQTAEQGGCIARYAALEAGLPTSVSGSTINRLCGSSLEAVNVAAAKILAGACDLVVAGGVESMSRVPLGSDGGAAWDPATQWKVGCVPPGVAADLFATVRGITRAEADQFALNSQKRAAEASDLGAFRRSLIPVHDVNGLALLERDECVRSGTSYEQLETLEPAFESLGVELGLDYLTRRSHPEIERIEHIHTAGNSCAPADGASAVLLGRESKGKELGLKPRAYLRAFATAGDDPVLMLNGSVPATEKALRKAEMQVSDIDLFEVNEAFAVVPLAFMRAFDLADDRVNVTGGAIALGHPLGATGAMLLGTLIDNLELHGFSTGLVTLCIGAGMGITTIVERAHHG